jgi:hypothetical protein
MMMCDVLMLLLVFVKGRQEAGFLFLADGILLYVHTCTVAYIRRPKLSRLSAVCLHVVRQTET